MAVSIEEIAVIDIETTGFNTFDSHIVEIGIAKVNLKTGKITPLFDKTVCETRSFDKNAWIFKHSTLTPEEVMLSEDLEDYRDEIQTIFNKYIITAYNKKFDLSFMRSRGFKIKHESQCIMIVSTGVLKIPYRGKYKYPKVTEAYKFLFKDPLYNEEHRAIDDAMDEARILYELYRRNIYQV